MQCWGEFRTPFGEQCGAEDSLLPARSLRSWSMEIHRGNVGKALRDMWHCQCYLVDQLIHPKGHTEREPLLSPEARVGRLQKAARRTLRLSCTLYSTFRISTRVLLLLLFLLKKKTKTKNKNGCLELSLKWATWNPNVILLFILGLAFKQGAVGWQFSALWFWVFAEKTHLLGWFGQPGIGKLRRWLSPMSAAGPGHAWETYVRHANVACMSLQQDILRSSRSSTWYLRAPQGSDLSVQAGRLMAMSSIT